MPKTILRGGHIIDPRQGLDDIYDVLIEDEEIAAVEAHIDDADAEIYDATGMFVFPGLVDMHVHSREPGEEYKEDVHSASHAAAAGGFTAIAVMANTVPTIDNAAMVASIYDKAAHALVFVYPIGAVTKKLEGKELCEFADMAENGAIAFSDDGKTIADSELMRNALTYASQLDLPILVHELEPSLSAGGQMHEGNVASICGMKGIPVAAETIMIARDIDLLRLSGGRLHIQHISTKEGLQLVRAAKKEGLAITCEATPHHLVLSDELVLESGFDSVYKMMPPLRSHEHIAALREALADGTIDAIATDHAPHAPNEKDNPFDQSLSGVIGLETALSVVWTHLVETGIISKNRLVELMSVNPTEILGIPGGSLDVGNVANITIFDPRVEWTVDKNKMKSKSKNTPFHGTKLHGKVKDVFVAGQKNFDCKCKA